MDELRKRLQQRLLASGARLPTGRVARIGKTAMAVLRGAGAMRRGDAEQIGEEALERWVSSIGELKGVAMKMGQILSYIDLALPQEVQRALSVLQTHAQPMPEQRVRAVIEAELGERAVALLSRFEFPPIAAASIGQVHRATVPVDGGQRVVAVKVQYPEVERAIEADFASASIGPILSSLVYPGAQVAPLIEEARARFLEECDYGHEAEMQARFSALYRGHETLFVPDVLPEYCSRRVLTTAFVDGQSFDAFLQSGPSAEVRDRIGASLFEFYLGSLFRHGLYNCDPHPGNYLFIGEGRVAVLDHGCARAFERDFVEQLARVTLAAHADDEAGLRRALQALAIIDERPELFETARGLLRAYFGPTLQDREQAIELGQAIQMREAFASKRELMKLHLPGAFLFLFRIRFGLLSVLARLGARANWSALELSFARAALPNG